MPGLNEDEMNVMGYEKTFDYSQYSHINNVNVIPEKDFKRLVEDTFKTIADVLRPSYGPYGSIMMISENNETTTTKDGYNIFRAMGFSHAYKKMVYLTISKIISRVNKRVGDGTTSCILLAEKMFKQIRACIHTPDDERDILKILSAIEKDLQDPNEIDKDSDVIKKLNINSLMGLLSIAGNYDPELVNILADALAPVLDERNNIVELRNIVVESAVDQDGETNVNYETTFLPGDYRVRVNMGYEQALLFLEPRKIKVCLFDHAFGDSDWNFFMNSYDKETETLIIARSFNKSFMDTTYVKYCKERSLVKQPITIIPCELKGVFRTEIEDLAAILNTKPYNLTAKPVDHTSLPEAKIQIIKDNCMCFFTDNIPEEYIKSVVHDMESDTSESMISRHTFMNRIKALKHETKDTMITVKAGTSLELKMICDKIDDCICAVNSAFTYGIVPNMLVYGNYRILNMEFENGDTDLTESIIGAISDSIKGLFNDIWISKHGDSMEDKYHANEKTLYNITDKEFDSFDIIRERLCGADELPSSAQYDLEVIVAAISIVKYLLTARALIFDAHLMQSVTDTGHYEHV